LRSRSAAPRKSGLEGATGFPSDNASRTTLQTFVAGQSLNATPTSPDGKAHPAVMAGAALADKMKCSDEAQLFADQIVSYLSHATASAKRP
jgi:hypothetical protein